MANILDARRRRRDRGNQELAAEVKKQFVGSDLEVGYTYVYVWLCNQFGHFMLGFAGSIAFSWLVTLVWQDALGGIGFWERLWPPAVIGVLWLLIWVGKELLLDVGAGVRNLRTVRIQRDAVRRALRPPPPEGGGPFDRAVLRDVFAAVRDYYSKRGQPPRGQMDEEAWFRHDLVRDSEIDCWFYLAGTVTAIAMFAGPGLAHSAGWQLLAPALPIVTCVVMFLLSVPVSRDWLWEKVAFDKAEVPFVGRFALNSRPTDEETRRRALAFAFEQVEPGHLVVIGPPKSGRTTTAVSLGVEALLRSEREIVVYTTLCKLLDRVAEEWMHLQAKRNGQVVVDDRPVWPPERAELLIVDDVGAQGRQRPLLTAEAFGNELAANDLLHAMFENKRVIWVVGDDPERAQKWEDAIQVAFGRQARIARVVPGATTIPVGERLHARAA